VRCLNDCRASPGDDRIGRHGDCGRGVAIVEIAACEPLQVIEHDNLSAELQCSLDDALIDVRDVDLAAYRLRQSRVPVQAGEQPEV